MGYDSIAEAYDRFVRNRTMIHAVTLPAIMQMRQGGGRVLDVACGQGWFAPSNQSRPRPQPTM